MSENFTKLQERFIEEYLLDLNAGQAAKRAGSKAKDIYAAGAGFLRDPKIAAEIDRRKLARSERTRIDADWLLKRLADEAEADIADLYGPDGALLPVSEWPEIWRKGLVAGVDTEEIRVNGVKKGEIKKIRLSDRIKRLALIGKHIGVNAFTENVNHTGLDALADRLARAKKRREK
ncbi:terminase small subunit [Breoghania sp.]|uniref:terminase small subunit n=1 Tax=Breoghania sp. TaxID=2065378 RepID=UPI002AA878A4|nr:terminase small subunit [Breoghania sp.]